MTTSGPDRCTTERKDPAEYPKVTPNPGQPDTATTGTDRTEGPCRFPRPRGPEVFGSERLTRALLDRLTHHVHILAMNGESYRLKRSRENAVSQLQTNRTKNRSHRQPRLFLPRNLAALPNQLPPVTSQWYTITPPQWPNISAPLMLMVYDLVRS